MPRHMGVRPDEPSPEKAAKPSACDEYRRYFIYAQELQEAYHARASQNRAWIYIAGILGLGTVAATGGLGAATAASAGTLALLSVSGGFTTGVFATLDNATLADMYTIAANRLDTARRRADAMLPKQADRYGDEERCAEALTRLRGLVTRRRRRWSARRPIRSRSDSWWRPCPPIRRR